MKAKKGLLDSILTNLLCKKEDIYLSEVKKIVDEYHKKIHWGDGFENKYELVQLVYVTGKSQYSIEDTYEAIKNIELLNYKFERILLKNRYSIKNVSLQVIKMLKAYNKLHERLANFYKYALDISDHISFDNEENIKISGKGNAYKFDTLKIKCDEEMKNVTFAEMNYEKAINNYFENRDQK